MRLPLISTLIALTSIASAYESFQQVSAGVKSYDWESSYIKLDHQSHFNPSDVDSTIFQLTHTMAYKYLQNDFGLGFRHNLGDFTIGTNFYYTMTSQPAILLHQLSPGIEVLYGKAQIFYNVYLPTADQITNPVSELGINIHPIDEVKLGLYPFYEHNAKAWGLNIAAAYTHNKRFEFTIAPFIKGADKGCAFSVGMSFGDTTKKQDAAHKSNNISYHTEKAVPPIYLNQVDFVEQPVQPVQQPAESKSQKPPQEVPKSWWGSYFTTMSKAS
jgi:hypothetical protein